MSYLDQPCKEEEKPVVNTRTGEKELLSRERRSKCVVVETVYLIVRSCNIPNPDDP